MNRFTLLSNGILVGILALAQPVRAQYLLAGQTAGAAYVDLVPDKEVYSTVDSLDLDKDGKFDLYLKSLGSSTILSYTKIKSLHDNVEVYTTPTNPRYVNSQTHIIPNLIAALSSNDTIQLAARRPAIWSSRTKWDDHTSFSYSEAFCLSYCDFCARGGNFYASWIDTNEHYVGVRLRRTSIGNWSYGWLRTTLLGSTIIIKDYALSNTVLAQRPANAAGWQVYPIPATELLTVRAPVATTGHLTLGDMCGRVQFSAPFVGTSQQLDLSALAAGLYTLRLETSAGSFIQRIAKQ